MRITKCIQKFKTEEICKVFQKNFLNQDEKFNEDAFKTIITLLNELIHKVGVKDVNLITKLKICADPFKYLDKSIDFGLFYERENE